MSALAPPVRPPTFGKPPSAGPPGIARASHVPKQFVVKPWTGHSEGEKILLYGPNGKGKTTLASMAPNPVFIGLDDGGRKIRNPKTGKPVLAIEGIETFEDMRDALHTANLFPDRGTVVIDTITKAETLAAQHLFATQKTDSGKIAENLEDYGYGKGFNYLIDPIRLLLADLDVLVRRGINVLLLAQQSQGNVANLAGLDYVQDGPNLESRPKASNNVRSEVCGWVDNIFRLGYPDVQVERTNKLANKGKAHGTTERQIFTEPEVYFVAKNRSNGKLPAVVTFATRDDDSIWKFLFDGEGVGS